jgi:hypothetical protein
LFLTGVIGVTAVTEYVQAQRLQLRLRLYLLLLL